jgi:hypothetical protein
MTKSQKAVQVAQAEVSRIWRLMCLEAGVGTDSKFVVFPEEVEQKYGSEHRLAFNALCRAIKAEKVNKARRDRHAAMSDMGLKRVKGALGGTYYE